MRPLALALTLATASTAAAQPIDTAPDSAEELFETPAPGEPAEALAEPAGPAEPAEPLPEPAAPDAAPPEELRAAPLNSDPTPADPPVITEPFEERLRKYARNRARIVETYDYYSRYRGTEVWVEIGYDALGDYEFAQAHSRLTGTPVDPEIDALYNPSVRRMPGLLVSGYVVGGIALITGIIVWQMGHENLHFCDEAVFFQQFGSDPFFDAECDKATREQIGGIITAVIGGLIAAATLTYNLVSTSTPKRFDPLYSPRRLRQMVGEYNYALRQRLALPEDADQRVGSFRRRPRRRGRSGDWRLQLDVKGSGVVIRF